MVRHKADVVVVGAGAAGISAARTLRANGRAVLLVEALPRVGGRAHTERHQGWPLDLGCGWLHSADRNPLVREAVALGMAVDRSPSAWRAQYRDLGFPPADQQAAAEAYATFGDAARTAPPASDRAGDLIPPGDRWRAYVDALSGYMNGAELDLLSVADFLAYDDAAGERNWRLPDGYGTLFEHLAGNLPVALGTRVTAIDHGGARVRVATDRGTIRCGAAIVTVPTPCLASGSIRFTPALDDRLHAAAGLPLGLANKLFLHLTDPEAIPPETHLLGDPNRAETGSYYLRPFGRPLIECFFGGVGARALEAGGPGAAGALAREELGRLLGADFARGLETIVVTAWGREPTIGGSYSHALPGRAECRASLAAPVSERLVFAGEACSPHDFSTAHGAWESGIRAAALI